MSSDPIVERFFNAYTTYYQGSWAAASPRASGADTAAMGDLVRLNWGGISEDELTRLENRYFRGARLPRLCRRFFQELGFRRLDLPFVEVAATLRGGSQTLKALFEAYSGRGFVPIGSLIGDDGDLGFQVSGSETSCEIFLGERRGEGVKTIGPVFGSFEGMLEVLIGALSATTVELGAPPGSPEKQSYVAHLRNLDPAGFGGPGWDLVWKGRVL